MAKELLFSVTKKDLDISTFSGSGAGGQYRNRHPNCVRITHGPSGVTTTGTEQRSKEQNQRMAFRRLCEHPKFKAWLKVEASVRAGVSDSVEDMLKPQHLKVEGRKDGQWTAIE